MEDGRGSRRREKRIEARVKMGETSLYLERPAHQESRRAGGQNVDAALRGRPGMRAREEIWMRVRIDARGVASKRKRRVGECGRV